MRLVLVFAAVLSAAACKGPENRRPDSDLADPTYLQAFCKAKGGQLTRSPPVTSNGRTEWSYRCHIPPPTSGATAKARPS